MVDLHNHTPLCNHATGTPREYVKKAIKEGIKIYGFADHAPMDFDKEYRMSFDDMQNYEKEIKSLQEEFKEIKILIGYEVDFTPYVDERVLKRNVDYLIGSVHFLDNWGFDNPDFIKEWYNRDVEDVYKEYFSLIEKLAESKMFQIVGHLDLVKVFNFKSQDVGKIAKRAIEAIKENGLVVEINTAGLRKPVKEIYPSIELLKMIKEYEIDITFSSDAHSVSQVGLNLKKAIDIARKLGFERAAYFEKKEKKFISLKE